MTANLSDSGIQDILNAFGSIISGSSPGSSSNYDRVFVNSEEKLVLEKDSGSGGGMTRQTSVLGVGSIIGPRDGYRDITEGNDAIGPLPADWAGSPDNPLGIRTLGGIDFVVGSNGSDTVFLNQGDDWGIGMAGDDRLWGGQGNDAINGHDNNDRLNGNFGDDRLWGGEGDDTLNGGRDNDILEGGSGNDELSGDFGIDRLIGSGGSDRFVFRADASVGKTQASQADAILDFSPQEDRILIQGNFDLNALEFQSTQIEGLGAVVTIRLTTTGDFLGAVTNSSVNDVRNAVSIA
jgi:Ca2+-binding RTX toxin-like protein